MVGAVSFVGFLLTIPIANWLVQNYGIVDVGFGLQAPAAVYAVGVAFIFRDFVQRELGRTASLVGIVVGVGLSYIVAPDFATASALAFAASELIDFVVYSSLERRSEGGAMVASNVAGLFVDSYVFLTIAFGSLTFFWGQVVGKAWMGVVAVIALLFTRWIGEGLREA